MFVTASPAALSRLVVGRQSVAQAMDEGTVRVEGPPAFIRSLPRWLIFRAPGPAIAAGASRG